MVRMFAVINDVDADDDNDDAAADDDDNDNYLISLWCHDLFTWIRADLIWAK